MASHHHHASLGRQTLEEIRQKRAAEKLSKVSSGYDLSTTSNQPDNGGIKKSESNSKLSENDVGSLVAQLKDLQRKNAEFEDENKILSSRLQAKEVDCETLERRLNELEQNTIPSLRKALRDVAMEKDVVVVAREDLSAQIRTLRKRLKEAEEDQYRAEEDAGALRAELNSVQQQYIDSTVTSITSMGNSPDHFHLLEKELGTLKLELEKMSKSRQQERQILVDEQARVSTLMSEKQELELKLVDLTKSGPANVLEKEPRKAFSLQDKENLENQLHDMAVMIERLESGRQKLLAEIDSQSSEIEKLFEENLNLTSAYQEAQGMTSHWENQVKECLKQNEELRGTLNKLRYDQMNILSSNGGKSTNDPIEANNYGKPVSGTFDYTNEVVNLKVQLAQEQTKAEGLAADVMQLSLQLRQATRAYNGLAHAYKPILRNVESSLVKMKYDIALPVK